MNTPQEFKKTDPWDYTARDQAQVYDLKPRWFATVSGTGDPNGEPFAAALTALYGLSYAVRMSYRSPDAPAGSGPYTVGVLQGRWDLADLSKPFDVTHKDNLAWTLGIRQPEFLTQDLFERFRRAARDKAVKKNASPFWYDQLKLELAGGGLFAQILHRGPYDTEPATFARLEQLSAAQGYARSSKIHYEIYLGDPRKTEATKLRTILRIPVAKMHES